MGYKGHYNVERSADSDRLYLQCLKKLQHPTHGRAPKNRWPVPHEGMLVIILAGKLDGQEHQLGGDGEML